MAEPVGSGVSGWSGVEWVEMEFGTKGQGRADGSRVGERKERGYGRLCGCFGVPTACPEEGHEGR